MITSLVESGLHETGAQILTQVSFLEGTVEGRHELRILPRRTRGLENRKAREIQTRLVRKGSVNKATRNVIEIRVWEKRE